MPKLQRTNANDLASLIKRYLTLTNLAPGINSRCIFTAWDKVSNAKEYTVKRFYRDETLYVTMTSSVISNQLYFRKEDIRIKINEILAKDSLFQGGIEPVKKIVIK